MSHEESQRRGILLFSRCGGREAAFVPRRRVQTICIRLPTTLGHSSPYTYSRNESPERRIGPTKQLRPELSTIGPNGLFEWIDVAQRRLFAGRVPNQTLRLVIFGKLLPQADAGSVRSRTSRANGLREWPPVLHSSAFEEQRQQRTRCDGCRRFFFFFFHAKGPASSQGKDAFWCDCRSGSQDGLFLPERLFFFLFIGSFRWFSPSAAVDWPHSGLAGRVLQEVSNVRCSVFIGLIEVADDDGCCCAFTVETAC